MQVTGAGGTGHVGDGVDEVGVEVDAVGGEDAADEQDTGLVEGDLVGVDFEPTDMQGSEDVDEVVDELVFSLGLDGDVVLEDLTGGVAQGAEGVVHSGLHGAAAVDATLEYAVGPPDALVGHDAEVALAVLVQRELPVGTVQVHLAQEAVSTEALDEGLGAW